MPIIFMRPKAKQPCRMATVGADLDKRILTLLRKSLAPVRAPRELSTGMLGTIRDVELRAFRSFALD
jgi:hypothetical protein